MTDSSAPALAGLRRIASACLPESVKALIRGPRTHFGPEELRAEEAMAQRVREAKAYFMPLFEDYAPEYVSLGKEEREYLDTHWRRFLQTLDLIPPGRPLRILEVGTMMPYPFTLMMLDRRPDIRVEVSGYDASESEHVFRSRSGTRPDVKVPVHAFNCELDRWPFESGKFDLIMFTEVLEHLTANPYHVFSEALRVLVPGGQFLVTTPNIACYESVHEICSLRSPYTFGVYSRHGAYGRHNREYVPGEVEGLGRSVGFATTSLKTLDCYGFKNNPVSTVRLLRKWEGSNDLRKQVIFYLGTKSGAAPEPLPPRLYDYDPRSR